VDTVPDPLLLRKSGSAGNRTRTSGCAARNSDRKTREVLFNFLIENILKIFLILGGFAKGECETEEVLKM
jgi:hypothetical protein